MWTLSNARWAYALCLCIWLATPVAAGHGVGVIGMVVTSPHWPWVGPSFGVSLLMFLASLWKKQSGLLSLGGTILALGLLVTLVDVRSSPWCFPVPFFLSLLGLFWVAGRAKVGVGPRSSYDKKD